MVEHLILELPSVTRDPDLGNWKSKLLEHVQKEKTGRLFYQTTDERGPDHDKTFIVQVLLDQQVLGQGRGESKKQAQQVAARAALETLGIVDENGVSMDLEVGEAGEDES